MILCDREIEAAIEQGRLVIAPPPKPEQYDSTTVDLYLDGILDQWVFPKPTPGLGQGEHQFCPGSRDFKFRDIEREFTRPIDISSVGHPLPPVHLSNESTGPRHFILGWTAEKIYLPHTSRLCARVEGKSSLGRMGVGVHVTAPTIHAGFGFNEVSGDHGAKLRLEIWNAGPLPVVLLAGMRICQLIIEEVREVPKNGTKTGFNMQGPKAAKK